MRQIVDATGRDRGGRQIPMSDDEVRIGPSENEDDETAGGGPPTR